MAPEIFLLLATKSLPLSVIFVDHTELPAQKWRM